MRWIKNINPKNILEPSCGDGIFLKSIDAYIKNCHVEAIELLKREAVKARKIKKSLKNNDYKIITTEKDYYRLDCDSKKKIEYAKIELVHKIADEQCRHCIE